eukprot:gene22903-31206_t
MDAAEAAEDRRTKLQGLRDKASKKRVSQSQEINTTEDIAVAEDGTEDAAKKKAITFRNYKPYDTSLLSKTAGPTAKSDAAVSVQKKAAAAVASTEDILQVELALVNQGDELNIVPKKPNWDLKSQVAAKMEKLARRTQRAVVEILREKMATEEGEGDGEETDNEAE